MSFHATSHYHQTAYEHVSLSCDRSLLTQSLFHKLHGRMADILGPLEKLYLLHPKVFNRQHDVKYWMKNIASFLITLLLIIRLIVSAFYPQFGRMIRNYFNVLGVAGQVMSLGAGMCCTLIPYFRLRLLLQKDNLSFMTDLMAYKDERLRPILTRTNREKLIKFSEKVLKFLKIAAPFFVMEIWLTMMVVGIVIPLMVEGITMSNILFWSLLSTFPVLILGYYLGMDLIYIFASIWYLPKYHLDIQTDVIIDRMEQFLTEPEIRDIHVIYLDHVYNQLLIRVKKFDQLSRDIISPARFAMSYSIGFMIASPARFTFSFIRFTSEL